MTTPQSLAEEAAALGPDVQLDGSLASLWEIDQVVTSLRRAPYLADACTWLPDYLATFAHRALSDLDPTSERDGDIVRTTGTIPYEVDCQVVVTRLLSASRSFPAFYGSKILGLPVLGTCFVPFWGLATVFRNHALATTTHDRIGRQRDRMNAGIAWVIAEQLRVHPPDDGLQEPAATLMECMSWPPIGYATNDSGQHNRHRLFPHLVELPTDVTSALTRHNLAHPDHAIRLLAAWCAWELGLEPVSAADARQMQLARAFFRIDSSGPVQEAVAALNLAPDDAAGGGDPTIVEQLRRLDRAPVDEALAFVNKLTHTQPTVAAYTTALGWVHQRRDKTNLARQTYERAIAQDPSFFLARVNLGALLSMNGEHDAAIAQLEAAREIWPFSPDIPNNLLCALFFKRLSQQS